MIRRMIRGVTVVLSVCAIGLMGTAAFYESRIPDSFYVVDGNTLSLNTKCSIVAVDNVTKKTANVSLPKGTSKNVELRLFGIIPIKQTRVESVEEKMVMPCGTPFGIKMFIEGVMVVGINEINTENGMVNPAKQAGLKTGDIILSLDGSEVSSNEDIAKKVSESGGKEVKLAIRRDDKDQTVSVKPALSKTDNTYKLGVWVRDSSAGIGTMTFYDPQSGIFAGLGHAICDVDTGETMPVKSGEIVNVSVFGIIKGAPGSPGELQGQFASSTAIGKLVENNETGVFGSLYEHPVGKKPVPIAMKQQIEEGEAEIYATISGTEQKAYKVEIEKVDLNKDNMTKNMIVKVVDEELIEKTGGIVQGMSGSPIIQNGMLVGAVTHVLVNDPLKGYGIFAENMYSVAKSLPTSVLAEAS